MPPLHLCRELESIISAVSAEMPVFSHISPEKLRVYLSRSRGGKRRVTLAKIIGREETPRGYRLSHFPEERLYAIFFYWPRFFDMAAPDKLNCICHELYHISDEFDGRMRRIGRSLHGASVRSFEKNYRPELEMFQTGRTDFLDKHLLRMNSATLMRNYRLNGEFYRLPRLLPV